MTRVVILTTRKINASSSCVKINSTDTNWKPWSKKQFIMSCSRNIHILWCTFFLKRYVKMYTSVLILLSPFKQFNKTIWECLRCRRRSLMSAGAGCPTGCRHWFQNMLPTRGGRWLWKNEKSMVTARPHRKRGSGRGRGRGLICFTHQTSGHWQVRLIQMSPRPHPRFRYEWGLRDRWGGWQKRRKIG